MEIEKNIKDYKEFDFLNKFTHDIQQSNREIVGREEEMNQIIASLARPELCNIILLGDAGSGKTALVQGVMCKDSNRKYLEVDLTKMTASCQNDINELSYHIKSLFKETQELVKKINKEIVLFIDEFHLIVQLSVAAVEALKPLLANSGTRGIRVITATTFSEFDEYIKPNQPLMERLQRINVVQPQKEVVVEILKNFAIEYNVEHLITGDGLYENIYEYTNRYIPASSQPRKSILILDSMVGWHNAFQRKLDMSLLADVIQETTGVNITFKVDATKIKEELDSRVFSQEFATTVIEQRLQLCVADFNDTSKPMSSFLFTGSTGVGKGLIDDCLIPVYDKSGKTYVKRNGDLKAGDFVFSKNGKKIEIAGVFPQGLKTIYEVEFSDGRKTYCDGSHLWAVYPIRHSRNEGYTIYNTETLIKKGVKSNQKNGKVACKYSIPVSKAVEWVENKDIEEPYKFGAGLSKLDNITKNYKFASIEQRKEIIKGFFDKNGFVNYKLKNPTVYCLFNNEELCDFIQYILWSLGIIVKKSIINKKFKLTISSKSVNLKDFFKKSNELNKLSKYQFTENNNIEYIGIKSITKLTEKKKTTCIYVKDDEHLYLTDNFVVTHNTEMAKQLARILFNDERNLIRFDMTEYANDNSLDRFRDELTQRVWARPYSIILFDEVEKACGSVTRILLQVLDDGRMIDRNNRETSFLNAYIILTTNAGSEIYKTIGNYAVDDTGSGKELKKYDKLIRKSIIAQGESKFPPELLGRIDCIVPFQPLSHKTMEKIVLNKLNNIKKMALRKHNITVEISAKCVDYIVHDNLDSDSDSGGARIVMTKIEQEITTAIARFINKNKVAKKITVGIEGEMTMENKQRLESSAYVRVVAVRR